MFQKKVKTIIVQEEEEEEEKKKQEEEKVINNNVKVVDGTIGIMAFFKKKD